jgi:sulfide:quinone oxidoreductase
MAEISAPRTVILGGGIAAIEALLALADLAGERTDVTLVSPEPDFLYKPLTVEEPFTHQPAEQHELEPLVSGVGARFVRGAADAVDVGGHRVALADGTTHEYEFHVVCVGGHARAALEHAVTFRVAGDPLEIDSLIGQALAHHSKRLAFVVPPGVSWSLPIYELALMTRSRVEEKGIEGLRLTIVSPEEAPLILFGRTPSDALAKLLSVREIDFQGGSFAVDGPDGLVMRPREHALAAGGVVALPKIEGPHIDDLPSDDRGFIPIDDHARVTGADDVYAAGDGTNFPVKQGGLATQQADAAAADIAFRLGAEVDAEPFHPVLRGQLIVGTESLNLKQDITGGHGEGVATSDYLWWPPHKVSGRYLSPWLAGESPHPDPAPPEQPIEIEVGMPREWHREPMALDPYSAPPVD